MELDVIIKTKEEQIMLSGLQEEILLHQELTGASKESVSAPPLPKGWEPLN